MGECHKVCEACNGPTFLDCYSCQASENTMMNPHGVCECSNEQYTGPLCAVYIGLCHELCIGCFGPQYNQCIECVPNAIRKSGECVCEHGFTNGCKEYNRELCHPICEISHGRHPCPTGPSDKDCDSCNSHAYRDVSGACVCLEDWSGEDCSIYSGSCSPVCEVCNDPTSSCEQCVPHASQDTKGQCHCDTFWNADATCSLYSGACHEACAICDGSGNFACLRCALNASWQVGLGCKCNADWSGQQCETYMGLCDPICNPGHCFGPLRDQCYQCGNNAYFNSQNTCVCNATWAGNDCSLYTGDCSLRCTKCTGPAETDCQECIENADPSRNCACETGYTGPFCDYAGECDSTCESCFGPNVNQCYKCVEHASRDSEGICRCLPDWSGPGCSIFMSSVHTCDSKCNPEETVICNGPLNTQCTSCREHAHHADYDLDLGQENDFNRGGCICDQFWLGHECTLYAGACDPRCASCSGPTNTECYSCTEFATLYQRTCTCREDSIGPGCQYAGSCDDKCVGCRGPGPESCIQCVPNAFRDDDVYSRTYGQCVCLGSWTGPKCQASGASCGENCLICDPERGQCLRCSGSNALLPDHSCSPCPPECKECSDANSDGFLTENECTSCYEGNYVTPQGQCANCSIRCKECSSAAGLCSSCWGDSWLHGNTCECSEGDGYYLNAASGRCVRECPTLFAHAAGECIHNRYAASDSSLLGALGHYLSVRKLYLVEVQDQQIALGDAIHPHQFWFNSKDSAWITDDRGFYFTGNKNLELHNLVPFQTMSLVYWFYALESDVNIHYRQYKSWNSQEPTRSASNKLIEPETVHTEHLWLSSCNEVIIEALGIQVETDEYEYEGGWARLVVQFMSEQVEKTGTDITMVLNDSVLGKGSSIYSVYQQYKQNPWYFGRGLLHHPSYNFNGFIYDIEYHPIVQPTDSTTFGICGGCHFCPANNQCFSICELDSRFDPTTGQCIPCRGCTVGCRHDGTCQYPCDDSCGSCARSSCSSCMSNATLISGTCVCDSQFTGDPKACISLENACQISNCAICDESRDSNQCMMCDDGFSVGRHECTRCSDDSSCDPYVDKLYRQPTGDCICEAYQYWSGETCVDCSPECNHCTAQGPFNCTSCRKGHFFAPGSDYCLEFCATGFATHSTNKTCQGNPGIVANFEFELQSLTKWTYRGHRESPKPHTWQVLVYGGYNAETLDKTDPYITDDRGLWFDGKYTFLTIEKLVLHHSCTIEMWIKAHCSDGTLFSSSRGNSRVQSDTNIHFAISDTQLEFADTFQAMSLQNKESLEVYFWTHVAVAFAWNQVQGMTNVGIYNNGSLQGTTEYAGITIDFPDETSVHRIGAVEAQSHLFDLYRGFIHSFKVWNKPINDFTHSVHNSCGSACHFCPEVGMCLGVCNWNHYWNQSKCVRCPLWCEGCLQDGTCSAN